MGEGSRVSWLTYANFFHRDTVFFRSSAIHVRRFSNVSIVLNFTNSNVNVLGRSGKPKIKIWKERERGRLETALTESWLNGDNNLLLLDWILLQEYLQTKVTCLHWSLFRWRSGKTASRPSRLHPNSPQGFLLPIGCRTRKRAFIGWEWISAYPLFPRLVLTNWKTKWSITICCCVLDPGPVNILNEYQSDPLSHNEPLSFFPTNCNARISCRLDSLKNYFIYKAWSPINRVKIHDLKWWI